MGKSIHKEIASPAAAGSQRQMKSVSLRISGIRRKCGNPIPLYFIVSFHGPYLQPFLYCLFYKVSLDFLLLFLLRKKNIDFLTGQKVTKSPGEIKLAWDTENNRI
jgi:hypothetical protein